MQGYSEDAREALRALVKAGRAAGVRRRSGYLKEITLAKQRWEKQLSKRLGRQVPGEAMSQGQVIRVINEEARAENSLGTNSLPDFRNWTL